MGHVLVFALGNLRPLLTNKIKKINKIFTVLREEVF
jgi:hypothetical protein